MTIRVEMAPNLYVKSLFRIIMPIIRCPHCDDEISLDDDQAGRFDCPHCSKEFEWNTNPIAPPTTKTVIFVALALICAFSTISMAISDDSSESCDTSQNPDCQNSEGESDVLFAGGWDEVIGDLFLIPFILLGAGAGVAANIISFCFFWCCFLMTAIFSLLAVRGYSKDKVLFDNE